MFSFTQVSMSSPSPKAYKSPWHRAWTRIQALRILTAAEHRFVSTPRLAHVGALARVTKISQPPKEALFDTNFAAVEPYTRSTSQPATPEPSPTLPSKEFAAAAKSDEALRPKSHRLSFNSFRSGRSTSGSRSLQAGPPPEPFLPIELLDFVVPQEVPATKDLQLRLCVNANYLLGFENQNYSYKIPSDK